MTSAAERLSALKAKLQTAREENLHAVEDESKRLTLAQSELSNRNSLPNKPNREPPLQKSRRRTRTYDSSVEIDSADEAEGEDEDDRLRSMKKRAKKLKVESGTQGMVEGTVEYGKTGSHVKKEGVERMMDELKEVEKKREKFRRRRAFVEDRTDINFINEGNRLFNRQLDKHFDKFEEVKKIKDSLERGTA